jgi:hypothetical protein
MTEIVITALKTDGRPWMPAVLIAMTNGEYLVLAPDAKERSGSSDGTMRPTISREMT